MNRFLAVVVAPFVGLIMLTMGVYDLYLQVQFDNGGDSVEGTVLAIEPDKGSRPSSGPKSVKVAYRFTTHDGRTLEGVDSVSGRTARKLRDGGPVGIQYLAGDPSTNHIYEVGEAWLYVVWICVGIGFIAVGPIWRRWFNRPRAPGAAAAA